jgi:hypothetical protein
VLKNPPSFISLALALTVTMAHPVAAAIIPSDRTTLWNSGIPGGVPARTKGSYSVTVANGSGFAAGQFMRLDEDNCNTGSWLGLPNRNGQATSVTIWATDRSV